MYFRNLSPQQMFATWAETQSPQYRFEGSSQADFESWKSQALGPVQATVGDFPATVEPNPELIAEWHHDGLRKQRWLIDVGVGISASFLINYPGDFQEGEKRAALLCWHGHGYFGKEAVMGNDSSSEIRASIANHNYNYGHQMAKAGFITFAIDWIGAGERNDGRPRNGATDVGGRDWCNLLYLNATMLGMTSLSINVQHGRLATDFACSLPGVNENRLGVMGISGGGTMTLWSSLLDERFRATEIICYSGSFAHFGISDNNYCGMQVAPGLFKLADLGDLQGLIAPRPLLVDIGVYDDCFNVDDSMACFKQVEKIYSAAGVRENLELDLHAGNHAWGGNKSVEFFQKHLG